MNQSVQPEGVRGTGQPPTQTAVLSWVLFRILEVLQEPVLVRAAIREARSYALDGVRYLLQGEIPQRYTDTEPAVQSLESQQEPKPGAEGGQS